MISDVAKVIREVGTAEVVSRFRKLAAGDVDEKSVGDYVTIADRECERVLTERLRQIRDIPVVGEEATAANPTVLNAISEADAAWVVDPIDGTSNFIAGSPDFAVMVALVEQGITVAAWIWHPDTDSMLTAERGHGVRINDEPFARTVPDRAPQGVLKTKYLPDVARTVLAKSPAADFVKVPHRKCAGVEYAALLAGEFDFLFYWRTLPWDHAPGSLLAEEAGLRVGRLDGMSYLPGDGQRGLLIAPPDLWQDLANPIGAALKA